jgi:NAD(P)-dependent dehydrogenase (short-subunit alcohol dehydrogenase family)
MQARFAGKSVLVLGGTSGIGLAAARGFAQEGARVAITGRNPAALESAAAEGLIAYESDIADIALVKETAARAATALGGLDIVIVNAGVGGFMPADQVTPEFWDHLHAINLRGCFFAAQSCLPHLRDNGTIIFTGSIGSMLALPGNAAYAAAKAGLRAVARILGHELLPRGIRVNMVSPGPTETEIFRRGATEEEVAALRANLTAAVPMKRMASAEEVARSLLFLASQDAAYINGVDLFVDGGCVEL